MEFVLQLEAAGDVVNGTASLDPVFIGRTTASLVDFSTDGDFINFTLRSKLDNIVYSFAAERVGGTLDGEVRWHDGKKAQSEPFTGFRREVRRFDTDVDRFPVELDPREVGVEPVLLDHLIIAAESAHSDALLVLSGGRLVSARTFGGVDDSTSVGSLGMTLGYSAAGNADLPSRLHLGPSDIAALGQALIDDGVWTGTPVVPKVWMDALAVPTSGEERRPGSPWSEQPNPVDNELAPIGYGLFSNSGEGLLLYPEAQLVVVRTISRSENRYDRRYDNRDQMEWLDEMAESIAVEKLDL